MHLQSYKNTFKTKRTGDGKKESSISNEMNLELLGNCDHGEWMQGDT